ncbi:unnamed protein product [Diamesa serratosioi]
MEDDQVKSYLFDPNVHTLADIEDVSVKVFRYLRGNDLLNAMLVCREWNYYISNSSQLMRKIVLTTSKCGTRCLEEILRESTRMYQHLSITRSIEYSLDFHIDKYTWRTIKIQKCVFDKKMVVFLNQFSMTLTEIEFYQMRTIIEFDGAAIAEFPNLEVLKLKCNSIEACYIILVIHSTLGTIKELTLPIQAIALTFHIITHGNVDIKLRKLHILGPLIAMTPEIEQCLVAHSNHLEELTIDCAILNSTIELIWNDMKALKVVKIRMRNRLMNSIDPILKANNSIKQLWLFNAKVQNSVYEKIFDATPNLTQLLIFRPERKIFDMCILRNKKMESMSIWILEKNFFENFFSNDTIMYYENGQYIGKSKRGFWNCFLQKCKMLLQNFQ